MNDKIAVITGASVGAGAATARLRAAVAMPLDLVSHHFGFDP